MMKSNGLREGLAVAIILLLIGIGIAPSINANISRTSAENELVEFTTEICGITSARPQTVKLTQKEAEAVEKLFDEINSKLDNVKTREETLAIFDEALVELDKYGVLGDMNIQKAQKLVTDIYQNQRVKSLLGKLNHRSLDEDENILCLTAGKTSNTVFVSPALPFFGKLALPVYKLNHWAQEHLGDRFLFLQILLDALEGIFFNLIWILLFFPLFSPVSIGNFICLGEGGSWFGEPIYEPTRGWIRTIGLNGIKKWEGAFWGNLPLPPLEIIINYYPGILGFTGLKIGRPSKSSYIFLGAALWVKIGPEHP